MLELISAFLYAGAAGVVAGLWRVDDDATALLMAHFYGHLASGDETAKALQNAQLALLRGASYAHPLATLQNFCSTSFTADSDAYSR